MPANTNVGYKKRIQMVSEGYGSFSDGFGLFSDGFQPFQGGSLLRLRFQSALRALSERFQSAFGSLPGRGTEMGADAESRATNGRPTIVRWLSDDRPTTRRTSKAKSPEPEQE